MPNVQSRQFAPHSFLVHSVKQSVRSTRMNLHTSFHFTVINLSVCFRWNNFVFQFTVPLLLDVGLPTLENEPKTYVVWSPKIYIFSFFLLKYCAGIDNCIARGKIIVCSQSLLCSFTIFIMFLDNIVVFPYNKYVFL